MERLLYKNIVSYDKCAIITSKINSWLRYIMCAYYYLMVPFIDLCVIVVIEESDIYLSVLWLELGFIIIINLFIVNYMLSLIARSAHYSYPLLNTCIARQNYTQNVLSLKLRLKILALIERLSGPVIGIYCYDLFPYTNHEFYIFCANCVKNFILLYDLTQ